MKNIIYRLFLITALGCISGCVAATQLPPSDWHGVDRRKVLQLHSVAILVGAYGSSPSGCLVEVKMLKELIREVGQSERFTAKTFRDVLVKFESYQIDVPKMTSNLSQVMADLIVNKLGADMVWVVWMPPSCSILNVAIYSTSDGQLIGTFETSRPSFYNNYDLEKDVQAMAKESVLKLINVLKAGDE